MSTKYKIQRKAILASILLLFLGCTFFLLENVFYQNIDEDGVLHESLFMPLSCLSIFLGLIVLLLAVISKLTKKYKQLGRKRAEF